MIVNAILAGFAGWRVASLLVFEDGPFSVFERLRAFAGVPKVGLQRPRPLIGGVMSCVYCASVWTCAAAFAFGELVSWLPVAVLAACGLAAALQGSVKAHA